MSTNPFILELKFDDLTLVKYAVSAGLLFLFTVLLFRVLMSDVMLQVGVSES